LLRDSSFDLRPVPADRFELHAHNGNCSMSNGRTSKGCILLDAVRFRIGRYDHPAVVGHGDVVIIAAVDRLSRDTTDLLVIARDLQKAGAGC
jgi:hypothetical protein